MKKLMSVMLGLSLVIGAASFAFADESKTDEGKKMTKKGGKKKGDKKTDETK